MKEVSEDELNAFIQRCGLTVDYQGEGMAEVALRIMKPRHEFARAIIEVSATGDDGIIEDATQIIDPVVHWYTGAARAYLEGGGKP